MKYDTINMYIKTILLNMILSNIKNTTHKQSKQFVYIYTLCIIIKKPP